MKTGKPFLKIATLTLVVSLLFVFSMPADGGTYTTDRPMTSLYCSNTFGEQAFLDFPLMKSRGSKRVSRREREARTILNSIATASIAFFAEKEYWGKTFNEIGYATCDKTRYPLARNDVSLKSLGSEKTSS